MAQLLGEQATKRNLRADLLQGNIEGYGACCAELVRGFSFVYRFRSISHQLTQWQGHLGGQFARCSHCSAPVQHHPAL